MYWKEGRTLYVYQKPIKVLDISAQRIIIVEGYSHRIFNYQEGLIWEKLCRLFMKQHRKLGGTRYKVEQQQVVVILRTTYVAADYRQSISHLPSKRGYLKTLILFLHDQCPLLFLPCFPQLHGAYYKPLSTCQVKSKATDCFKCSWLMLAFSKFGKEVFFNSMINKSYLVTYDQRLRFCIKRAFRLFQMLLFEQSYKGNQCKKVQGMSFQMIKTLQQKCVC